MSKNSLPSTSAAPPRHERDDDEAEASAHVDAADPVVVAVCSSLMEAELCKSRIASMGLRVHLLDSGVVGVASYLSHVVGGVKVVVDAADVDAARSALTGPVIDEDELEALALAATSDPASPSSGDDPGEP